MKSFMTVPLWVRILVAPIMVTPRLVGYHPYDGLYNGNKFRKYLNHSVPEAERHIEDLKTPFRAVAVNIVDGKLYTIGRGNLGYALQASSAVPGVRKPVEINHKLFVDGGFMANVPVTLAKEEFKPDIIIAVNVDERLNEVPLETFRKIGSVSKRMLTLDLSTMDEIQCKDADIVIHPNVDGIGLLSRSVKESRQAMDAGIVATKAAIPAIRASSAQSV